MAKQEKLTATLSDGTVLKTRLPNVVETQEADWEFSRVFNKAIMQGIPPRAAMLKQMMELNVWTQEEEEETSSLRAGIDSKHIELEEARKEEPVDEDKIAEIENEIRVAQQEYWVHTQKLNGLLSHTAENKAEDAKLYYLTFLCTETEEGDKVWKDMDAFRADTNSERINTAILQLMLLQSGLSKEQQEEVKQDIAKQQAEDTEVEADSDESDE